MDPLSLTASIIAVLQLTSTLTGYVNDIRDATTEQAKVAIEASNLYSLLTTLRFRVEGARSDDPWFNQVKLLGSKNGPLDQFKDSLETIVEQLPSRKRDQIKSALMWKFTKSEIENALKRMERLKSLITYALTNDVFTLSQAIHSEVVALSKRTEQLHSRTERLQTHIDQELQYRLSQWLELPDPSANYHTALEKRHPETGLWLLNSQQFGNWKTSASSLMWLYGDAGCGKTVLCAASLQNIIQHKGYLSDSVISYFYFDFNDAEKRSSRKAIRSLLFQFSLQGRDRLRGLEQLYQKCENGQQQPAEDIIQSLLRDAMAHPGQKYIILDALDECADRENLLPFLLELATSKQQGLRILATSRRERDIEEQLSPVANYIINIKSAVVDEDIRIYICDRLATDIKLKKWPKSVQNEITTVMMEKAGGMFRWVYCQLESIRRCIKLNALRKTLSSLPRTLDETYSQILQALESTGQLKDAITALRWLCFSNRPLDLLEMVEILAIENGDKGGFFPDERLPDPADVMVVCSSLISCNTINNNAYDDSGDHGNEEGREVQIQLAHFSVKEYLLSDRCAIRSDFQEQACHLAITKSCLHYLLHLCEKAPLTNEVVKQYPLAFYAAEHWWQHAQNIDGILDHTVLDLTLRLLTNENAALISWVQLYDIDKPMGGLNLSFEANYVGSPLYYAAFVGVSEVVEKILQKSIDVNAQGGWYGSALHAASRRGHEKVVKMLLDAGADVNAEGRYENALHAASKSGHEKIVKMLLDAGANVDAGGMSGNSLQAASKSGHEKVVKMLLDVGADVNVRGGFYGSALQAASMGGNEKIVKMLLDIGADVNTIGGRYGSALHAASIDGYEKIVKMLLDAGADVNAIGGRHGTALQAASRGGHENMVKMLLNAGADVNAIGGRHGNALQAASVCGHEKIVKMLLDVGADVNAIGGGHGNALQAASVCGHLKIVKMLLDAGADVNAKEEPYGNALQAASVGGHEKTVKMLLDVGADVNAIGGRHGNALQAASVCGHEKIVKMLLDSGADGNESSGILQCS